MKRTVIMLAIMASTVIGCQEELLDNQVVNNDAPEFTADVESFDYDTKTEMDSQRNVIWSSGDKIAIFQGCSVADKYGLKDEAVGTRQGKFSIIRGEGGVVDGDFSSGMDIATNIAFYPYMESLTCSNAELVDDSDIVGYEIDNVVLPSVQNYAKDSFGNGFFPMVAVTSDLSDHNLKFKNLLGAIKLHLKGTKTVTSIKIVGKKGEKLSGSATVTAFVDGTMPEVLMSDTAEPSVVLDCGEGVQLSESDATTFIIALPPVEFSDGFKVFINTSENGVYEVESSVSNVVYRSSILAMPEVNLGDLVEYTYFLNPETGEPAKFTFTQGWWEEVHTGYVKYYEVNGVRICQTVTDPVETADGTAYGFWGTAAAEGEGELNFKWYDAVNAEGKQIVELPVNYVYHHSTYDADVHIYDWYTYFTVVNPQAALAGVDYLTFVNNYGGSYITSSYDGSYITSYYDNGGFYFAIAYFYMIGVGGYSVDAYDVVAEAEGFVHLDYSVSLTASERVKNGIIPITFTCGQDVHNVKYAVYEGELTNTQIEEKAMLIADGSEVNVSELSGTTVNISEQSDGDYTLVAVSFDSNGNMQQRASISFVYVTAEAHDVYQFYDIEDLSADLQPDSPEGYFGTYDLYAVDIYDSPLRRYMSEVTVTESSRQGTQTFVDVKGLFSAAASEYGFDDTMTFEYYDGLLFSRMDDLYESDDYDLVLLYMTYDGKWVLGGNSPSVIVGGFIKEGYIAFVGTSPDWLDMGGWRLTVSDGTKVVHNMSVLDPLFVDQSIEIDDDVAMYEATASRTQLRQISEMINQRPMNYVESESGRIRSIVDFVKQ